nr:class I SAM-dependent methyltransferase [Ramlibacter paludis]
MAAFGALAPGKKVAVIGCGYGRETLQFAGEVAHVWGIDVSAKLLARTQSFLASRGIDNFSPVLASEYDERLPHDLDVVFSVVVMQHLTRDLVRDYFRTLRKHLVDGGVFVVQFLEELYDGVDQRDAELRVYEPSISWTLAQLAQLSIDTGLRFREVRTQMLGPRTLWHWVHFAKEAGSA